MIPAPRVWGVVVFSGGWRLSLLLLCDVKVWLVSQSHSTVLSDLSLTSDRDTVRGRALVRGRGVVRGRAVVKAGSQSTGHGLKQTVGLPLWPLGPCPLASSLSGMRLLFLQAPYPPGLQTSRPLAVKDILYVFRGVWPSVNIISLTQPGIPTDKWTHASVQTRVLRG